MALLLPPLPPQLAPLPAPPAAAFLLAQASRSKLTANCRAVLFDEEVRFSSNIDFQYPMKEACQQEMRLFCKDVPHGNARIIK